MARHAAALGLGLFFMAACDDLSENPCQDYVDYVCECHVDNPDLDCDTIRAVHANAGVELYEDCRVEHEALLQADANLGEGCSNREPGEQDTAP